MSVSKRVRYEVLRRDSHACRYCGAAAPDVSLVVDHVVPVALGGSDDPSNLATACEPCNSGKTSTTADAPVVAGVAADAARWATAMKQAAAEDRDDRVVREAALKRVADTWYRSLPRDWESSVERFLDAGLPIEVIVKMAQVANDARGVGDRWGYFCGCCWKRVRQLQERAGAIVSTKPVVAPSPPEGVLTTWFLDSEVLNLHRKTVALWLDQFGSELALCLCMASGPGREFCGDYACMLHLVGIAQGALFDRAVVEELIVAPLDAKKRGDAW